MFIHAILQMSWERKYSFDLLLIYFVSGASVFPISYAVIKFSAPFSSAL